MIETTCVRHSFGAKHFPKYVQLECSIHTRVEAASEQGELKSNEVSSVSYRMSKISMHTSRSKSSPNFDISLAVKKKIKSELIEKYKAMFIYIKMSITRN
jgi:hypothetical protein